MDKQTADLILSALDEHDRVQRWWLEKRTGQTDRINREVIHDLVCAGTPIAGGDGGYHLIKTLDECDGEIRKLRSYVFSLFRRLKGLRKARARYAADGMLQAELRL